MLTGNFELGGPGTPSGFKITESGNDISAERGPWHHPTLIFKGVKTGMQLVKTVGSESLS